MEHRSVIVRGEVITNDTPRYLEEITLAHALGVLREWTQQGGPKTEKLDRPLIRAGDFNVIRGVERWRQTGTLQLETAATTAILRELAALKLWTRSGVQLKPLYVPEVPVTEDLPGYIKELYTAAEEFRHTTETILGRK